MGIQYRDITIGAGDADAGAIADITLGITGDELTDAATRRGVDPEDVIREAMNLGFSEIFRGERGRSLPSQDGQPRRVGRAEPIGSSG